MYLEEEKMNITKEMCVNDVYETEAEIKNFAIPPGIDKEFLKKCAKITEDKNPGWITPERRKEMGI